MLEIWGYVPFSSPGYAYEGNRRNQDNLFFFVLILGQSRRHGDIWWAKPPNNASCPQIEI